jgi:lipopolysaccharide export system ATP-binding protein
VNGSGQLRDFITDLPAHETPMLIAMRQMVVEADAEGRVPRARLVERFREAYIARYGELARDGTPESRRLFEIRRMTKEEVDKYLSEQILVRLAVEGWLRATESREGEIIVFREQAWSRMAADRDGLLQLLDAEIDRRLREPAGEPAVDAALVADGSHIEARGLVKIYKRRRVVNEVDIELRQGEIVGLLGPNGAGKTTTFYMIVGLVAPDSGEVYLDGKPLTRVPMYRRARRGIGYLSQEPSVFRRLTVEQNLRAILETLPISRAERRERLEGLLDELSIKHLRRSKAYSLSGGERRRLEITRALVTDPKFMLLDEPFAGIDPIAVDDIQRIVAGLKGRGLGVLITDHNVRETLSITDRAYIMFDGRIHIEGTSEELVNDPQARKLYLGEDFRL